MVNFMLFLIFSIIYLIMLSIMVVFERNKPKNIILWAVLFLFTSAMGYAVYLISRIIVNKKKNSLKTKILEDEIYTNLSSKVLVNNETNLKGELFEFNKLAFNAVSTQNNSFDFFNSYEDYKKDLITTIKKANKTILLELVKINALDFEEIKEALIEKAKSDVIIKLVHDKHINSKLVKQLKVAGVKVYKFSKYNTLDGVYSNLRNIICVDGETVYLGNLNVTSNQLNNKYDVCDCLLKIKGDIVQTINLELHKDVVFASGKYIDYSQSKNEVSNLGVVQYITNQYEKDLELLIIKAISSAKKSIQLQVEEFIPTESLISLLNFAINSNIQVRLMVPLRAKNTDKFYATRAYAKELALLGANVYLYDGYIRFNSIVVDNEYVLYGSYLLDREYIDTALQNIIIIKDSKAVNHLNKLFDASIDNSYRINNANFMLLREKFFKNIV